MMRNPAALRLTRLRSPDIKAAIKLRRIAGQHFSAKLLRQPHAESGLPRRRRSNHGNQRQFRCARIHRNRICQARKSSTTSTSKSEQETTENLLADEFHLYASSIGKLYKNMMRISMIRAVESRRQWFKGIRRTDSGDRRAVQRLFSGAHLA